MDNPFAVLGLQPTLDLASVKRAWAQAVQRHPPHTDPEGFRRARAAYEQLSRVDTLQAAWLATPFDAETEWRQREARDGQRLAQLREWAREERQQAAAAQAQAELPRRFGQVVATWTLAEWHRRVGGG